MFAFERKILPKSAFLLRVLEKQVLNIGWNQFRLKDLLNLVLDWGFFLGREKEAVCPAGNEVTNFFSYSLLPNFDLVSGKSRRLRRLLFCGSLKNLWTRRG